MENAGYAWQENDKKTDLPVYRFTLSAAALLQQTPDEAGNINVLLKPLSEINPRTKATHQVYITASDKQQFDELAELLVSVNRKKCKECLLLNGFYTLKAIPDSNKGKYKKLNAIFYHVKPDTEAAGVKTQSIVQVGYAFLRMQLNLEYLEQEVGSVLLNNELGKSFYQVYIQKNKVLEMVDTSQHDLFLKAEHEPGSEAVKLTLTGIRNDKHARLLLHLERKSLVRTGFSDNYGNLIFIAYPEEKQQPTRLFYVHYNPDNQIRKKSYFPGELILAGQ